MRHTAAETETDTTLRIMRAMDRQQPITITYLKADGTETIRTIETYAIEVSNAGDILLKTMDRQSSEKRTFRLDRVVSYTVHRSTYTLARPVDAKPTVEKAFCTSCQYLCDADDLAAGPSGDQTCGDCLSTWADQDDAAEYRAYAFH
jgi:predicted DNA-binding transcriptional regulator YafY